MIVSKLYAREMIYMYRSSSEYMFILLFWLPPKYLAIIPPWPPTRLGRRRSSMQGNVRASVRETREQKNQRRASKALNLRRDSRWLGVGDGGDGWSSGNF